MTGRSRCRWRPRSLVRAAHHRRCSGTVARSGSMRRRCSDQLDRAGPALDDGGPGRRHLVDGAAGAADAGPGRAPSSGRRRSARRSPASATCSITPGSRPRRRCWASSFGTLLGIALAIGIVHVRTLDRSLMPWIIASQTVPILAIGADDHRRARQYRHHRLDPEGDHLGLSVVLPGDHRHGEGPALARHAAARSHAHLQCQREPALPEAALAGRPCRSCSPA